MTTAQRPGRRTFLTRTAAGGLAAGLGIAPQALLAAASQPGADAGPARKGGTLVASWGGLEPQALFVPGGGGSSPFQTATKILERLLKLDADLKFQPALALSVTPAADFRSYTIKLREGVTWHDGAPFTSADVVYNVLQHWKPVSAGIALKSLTGATATDPLTVVLNFDAPVPSSS